MNAHTPARQSDALPEPFRPAGRGAKSNASGRFERTTAEPVDDGWHNEAPPRQIRTSLVRDAARSIITTNDSPDISFDQSVNPYRGCEHGCIYCFARPTHAYWGYSAGLDFESVIFFKPGAAELLRKAFSKRGYTPKVIALGSNTDPYQPVERDLRITRTILETCLAFRHPVSIITKSAGVLRDIDLLEELARQNLAHVAISVTTLDAKLARTMEPRASTPTRRLSAITALSEAGVPVSIFTSPMIPGLNDHELENLLSAGAKSGASHASYVLLRLPLEVEPLFRQWLAAERPLSAKKIMGLIESTRGGKAYDSRFHARMKGEGPVAELIRARFERACRANGLSRKVPALRTDIFTVPEKENGQLSLF
ncbi:MAG: DNA repair photolyase [Oceanicaulis sp. HLUCCA04]|nr:MAG: DNA repair photolyase [Oceanicaulis sp. HLUCCA04]